MSDDPTLAAQKFSNELDVSIRAAAHLLTGIMAICGAPPPGRSVSEDYEKKIRIRKTHYEAALELAPRNTVVAGVVARFTVAEGAFFSDEARLALLNKIRTRDIRLYWLGKYYSKSERPSEATRALESLLKTTPTNARARLLYAQVLLDVERFDSVLEALVSLPADFETQEQAYLRGRALLGLGRWQQAVESLAPLAESGFAGSGWLLCELGTAHEHLGETVKAMALYAEGSCRTERARLLVKNGECFDAIRFWSVSRSEPEVDWEPWLQCYVRLGAGHAALRLLQAFADRCANEDLNERACAQVSQQLGEAFMALPPPDDLEFPGLHARLLRERTWPFVETKLPNECRESHNDEHGSKAALSPEKREIASSQALDPCGEVSPGGYWLLPNDTESTNGPIYLGVKAGFPYFLRQDGCGPTIARGVLHLDADMREIDEASITYPPVALKIARHRDGLRLSAPLEDILRDSDGDSITDLGEERMAMDPTKADTDGDGIGDRIDPEPLSPCRGSLTLEQQLVVHVIEGVLADSPDPVVVGLDGLGSPRGGIPILEVGAPRVIFVSSAHAVGLCSAAEKRQVVVIPRVWTDLYKAKFGFVEFLDISEPVFDESKERAFVEWDWGWQVGTVLLEKRRGNWRITAQSRSVF